MTGCVASAVREAISAYLQQEIAAWRVAGLDISVKRNAFGRQIDSRFRKIELSKGSPASLGTEACPHS